jgi:hypothetical protein
MSDRAIQLSPITFSLMMAAWMISISDAHGQESFWNWGVRPLPWSSPANSCSNGTCPPRNGIAPIWIPSPVFAVPAPVKVEPNHGAARPSYRVSPAPVDQPQMQSPARKPAPNRGSPYYETPNELTRTAPVRANPSRVIPPRVAPAQNVPARSVPAQFLPPQPPTAKFKTNNSPFYP